MEYVGPIGRGARRYPLDSILMAKTILCVMCLGMGYRHGRICPDCKGEGRVDHCVACSGRGKLWLGGSEYIDCPVCPSANGGIKTPKTHVMMGVTFAPYKMGAPCQK